MLSAERHHRDTGQYKRYAQQLPHIYREPRAQRLLERLLHLLEELNDEPKSEYEGYRQTKEVTCTDLLMPIPVHGIHDGEYGEIPHSLI